MEMKIFRRIQKAAFNRGYPMVYAVNDEFDYYFLLLHHPPVPKVAEGHE